MTVNKKIVFKTAGTLMVAGMLFGGPTAQAADVTGAKAEGDGFVAGNAISGNLDVPLAACGVGAAGIGVGTGVCKTWGGPLAQTGDEKTWAEAEGDGFIAGNAVALDADVPVAVCGVGVAGIGVGTGVCEAGGPLATTGDDVTKARASGDGFIAGNAVALDVDVPVAACGLGGAVIGVGTGVCEASGPLATTGNDVTKAEAEGDGFIAGNAIAADLDVPVAVCGVGAAGIGVGTGVCDASGPLATTGDDVTKAEAEGDGFLAGNAIALDADIPVAVCGLGLAVLGIGTGVCN
jgi:hypothetical protein